MTEQVQYTRDTIVARFIEIRDLIKSKDDAHKAEIAELKRRQDVIESYLLQDMMNHGETAFSTTSGTAFIKLSEFVRVADKEVFLEFVKQQDDLNFLTVSASKTHCMEFKDNTGNLPPGLSYTATKEVQIRRGKSKD